MRELHYQRSGAGRDVVLIHGWGLHGGVWTDFAAQLAPRYRVTVVDLPGHGRSRISDPYTLANLADAIAHISPKPAVLIGWSLGGLAALATAERHPGRVQALVLLGATPRFVQTDGWPCAVERTLLRQFADGLARDYEGTLTRFLTLQLGASLDRTVLKDLRQAMLAHAPTDAALQAGLTLLEHTDLRGVLPQINVPACVLHGMQDRIVPPAAGRYLAEALPDAKFVPIESAGHIPFLTHADICLREVEGMLRGSV